MSSFQIVCFALWQWQWASSCRALEGDDYVCDPMAPSNCLPLDALLVFRSRISRVLLHKYMPFNVPFFNEGFFEPFANMSGWRESGALSSLHYSAQHLPLALALICQGLIEAERRILDPNDHPSLLELAAAQLLPAVLAGPWIRVASSGWPIFAMLTRLAKGTKSKCSSGWQQILRVVNASGVVLPTSFSIRQLADLAYEGFPDDSRCLWEAADQIAIPASAVCIMIPPPGEPRPYVSARDCNAHWPRCETWFSFCFHFVSSGIPMLFSMVS